MTKTLALGVLVLGLALGACGSNKKSSSSVVPDASVTKDSGGSTGNHDSGSGSGVDAATKGDASTIVVPPPVTCGTGMCAVSDQTVMAAQMLGRNPAAPCCADPATVSCGSVAGGACKVPPPHDASCDQTFQGNALSGCCTTAGTCGIDGSTFGTGCFDISILTGTTAKKCGSAGNDGGTADGG